MNSSTKFKALLLSLMLFVSSAADASWFTQTAKYVAGGAKVVATNSAGAKAAKTIKPGAGSVISKAPGGLIIQALIGLGLSAVDYALDPANNTVVVKGVGRFCNTEYNLCANTLAEAKAHTVTILSKRNDYRSIECTQATTKSTIYCQYEWISEPGRIGTIPFYPTGVVDKQISYDTVANAINTLAKEGNKAAQQAIEAAVADEVNAGIHDNALDAAAENTVAEKEAAKDIAKDKDKTKAKEEEEAKEEEQEAEQEEEKKEDKKEDKFELPDFCKWAKFVCAEPPVEELQKPEVLEPTIPQNTVKVSFSKSCPADKLVPLSWGSVNTQFVLSYSYLCDLATKMAALVQICSTLFALYILAGIKS